MSKLLLPSLFFCAAAAFAQVHDAGAPDTNAVRDAVKSAALDYAEGYYSGNAERMERAIHPDLRKIAVGKLASTGRSAIGYSSWSSLVELSRSKAGLLDPAKRNLAVTILRWSDDLASVSLTSSQFNDYLQMVKIDSAWKIVNVLWTRGPETPNYVPPEPYNKERELKAASDVVQQYFDGVFQGEAEKIEQAVHPEFSLAQFVAERETGRRMINRSGASGIIEPVRAKTRVIPEAQRKVEIAVLDMMDRRAFVRATTPASECYLHLSRIDGVWKIVGMLVKPLAAPR